MTLDHVVRCSGIQREDPMTRGKEHHARLALYVEHIEEVDAVIIDGPMREYVRNAHRHLGGLHR